MYAFLGDRVIRLQDAETIIKYINAFTELSQKACYGTDAVEILRKASDYFSGFS
jgi:hypothetical protein